MVTIFVHRNAQTEEVDRLDPTWLQPEARAPLWVDLADPTPDEARLLTDVFAFHELAVEDALSDVHHPKVEPYDGYLYVILHAFNVEASGHRFTTQDVDFFLSPNCLVTVHRGAPPAIAMVRDLCPRNPRVLGDGPAAVMHRIVDAMVDSYGPEVEKLADRLDAVEKQVIERPRPEQVRAILAFKRDVVALRRVALPQRDVVSRLARREFDQIDEGTAYRFRDVYDHLVRLVDDAANLQDRASFVLEAHVSTISNRLNQVMKVLTVIATVFMPLTVLTGIYGMNVTLPDFPGGPAAQFWWILAIMIAETAAMLWLFRSKHWL